MIKAEKELKGRKSYKIFITRSPSTHNGSGRETPTQQVKDLDKGKSIASEPPKKLERKKYFKYHDYGNLQIDYPNTKAFTILQVEEIQAIEEESNKEEIENDVPTFTLMLASC